MKQKLMLLFLVFALALQATNPFPMGVIALTGTRIKLSTGLSSFTGPTRIKTLIFSNPGSNVIYIGDVTLDTSTLAGVILIVPSGGFRSIGGIQDKDSIDWGSLYVNGTNADKLVVSGQTIN